MFVRKEETEGIKRVKIIRMIRRWTEGLLDFAKMALLNKA